MYLSSVSSRLNKVDTIPPSRAPTQSEHPPVQFVLIYFRKCYISSNIKRLKIKASCFGTYSRARTRTGTGVREYRSSNNGFVFQYEPIPKESSMSASSSESFA